MGREIKTGVFSAEDFEKFGQRLATGLKTLEGVLARPDFGRCPPTVGAELELFCIDHEGKPLNIAQEILKDAPDSRFDAEIDRFNIEVNLTPSPLSGSPFTKIEKEIMEAVSLVDGRAALHGGETVAVGVLPSLLQKHLGKRSMSKSNRFAALDDELRRRRGGPFKILIEGEESLETSFECVTMEGAATAFQVHLSCGSEKFINLFNASLLTAAPVVAVAANSPLFLDRILWKETRIVLFAQAVDDLERPARVTFGRGWAGGDPLELFRDLVRDHSILLPSVEYGASDGLTEVMLHVGTVWQWCRPVLDMTASGHLRVEMRSLPAGPTPVDMAANMAFCVGVALALADAAPRLTEILPHELAKENFYNSARYGLEATLDWPDAKSGKIREIKASELVLELIPQAREALRRVGVDGGETEKYLAVIKERVVAAQTGADWQIAMVRQLEPKLGRSGAVSAMLKAYISNAKSNEPVARWKAGGSKKSFCK